MKAQYRATSSAGLQHAQTEGSSAVPRIPSAVDGGARVCFAACNYIMNAADDSKQEACQPGKQVKSPANPKAVLASSLSPPSPVGNTAQAAAPGRAVQASEELPQHAPDEQHEFV